MRSKLQSFVIMTFELENTTHSVSLRLDYAKIQFAGTSIITFVLSYVVMKAQ